MQVPVGELEARRGAPVPPQVAPSVVVTPEHLLEFAFGAAINAELIIIAATRTTAVLLMSLAFMTVSLALGIAVEHHRFGVREYTKAIAMPGDWQGTMRVRKTPDSHTVITLVKLKE